MYCLSRYYILNKLVKLSYQLGYSRYSHHICSLYLNNDIHKLFSCTTKRINFCKLSNAHWARNSGFGTTYSVLKLYNKYTFMINWTPTTAYNYTYFSLYCLYNLESVYLPLHYFVLFFCIHDDDGCAVALCCICVSSVTSALKWKPYGYAQLYDVRGNNLVIVVH